MKPIFRGSDTVPPSGNLQMRYRIARVWQSVFVLAITIAIIALVTLLLSIVNQSFGYVIVENKVDPNTVASRPLDELTSAELEAVLRDSLTRNRVRTIERELPLAERTQADLLALVTTNVIEPSVVQTYMLDRSLLEQARIQAELAEKYPNGTLEFRAWLNPRFLSVAMSPKPEQAGVRTALFGSLYLILITILFAFPIGVGAAIYLEEYADQRNRLNRIIQTNIENLAGVPSIVYGMLGLAIFVRAFGAITSGAVFGVTDSNGRTILSAGMTMALLILPVIIINAQEAIRAVPSSLREGSYGLGATRWQTIWAHVLPQAMPGILTGTILAISRAIGETAPLIVVGASTFITKDPDSVFARFTALPIQIYNWTTRPQEEFRHIAAAAILVLLAMLLSLNAFAILLRNHFRRRNT
jgi:phosphate transport system permease protein